ncbi:hypothetical protein DXG03_008822 [Asterophora parasitica]|uniref:SH3 domain-containing protein n=1 Tax=Asterophora parasitica TaxID=117018 RepID=A0A9P7GBK6_9AGAR|nr:hypothetical protein DXG03_008822 [Asterophora parasitica]
MQRRAHGRKRLNQNNLENRATEVDAAQTSAQIAEPTPSSATFPVSLPPTSITPLAVVASLFGAAFILAIVVWRFKTYKRRNVRAAPSLGGRIAIEKEYHSEKQVDFTNISNASIYTEKPQKAALSPRSFDAYADVAWDPPTMAYDNPAASVSLPERTAAPKSKAKSPGVSLSVKTPSDVPRSPPPSYALDLVNSSANDGQSPRLVPIPPSPAITSNSPPPPTPSANRKPSFALGEQHPIPAFSPRFESFTNHDLTYPRDISESPPSDESGSSQKLPRLMSVGTTFTPTLDDELTIKLGDTVRMLEEFRDGWCLVQRVGRIDAPKGAVPRFCLQERRGVIPILPSRKFSNGSFKSSSSGWR